MHGRGEARVALAVGHGRSSTQAKYLHVVARAERGVQRFGEAHLVGKAGLDDVRGFTLERSSCHLTQALGERAHAHESLSASGAVFLEFS